MDDNSVAIPSNLCGAPASPRETLAVQLRLMMSKVEGEDKCVLCKAAEELSKPERSSANWFLPFLIFMLFDGFSTTSPIDPDLVKTCLEAMNAKEDSKSEEAHEPGKPE